MHQQFTNHLINETSPYLLQHAHNPVDWYPWGEPALSRAKEENKVILVSIGYSACHWCHVMERESFEDEKVAAIMNGYFINIKIDREERPDLDHIYMDAIQAMTGSGGWPLNVFLTPDAKPFFGGTYFPPVKAFNRSSWTEILHAIALAWKERKNEIESQAETLTEHLQNSNGFARVENNISIDTEEKFVTSEQCDLMFSSIMGTADIVWGGFGKAPKFPQTFTIQYLLQYHYFTGSQTALQQALLSIDKMLMGGIFDHIGGGFARYSTDNEWLAPHFEKMLYDNALILSILYDAFQVTALKKYEDAIRKTISFVQRELMSNEGGFFAALDADSEGVEGKYYVWQKEEVDEVLGTDSALFCAFFDVTEKGNWEEKNILRTLQEPGDFAREKGMDERELHKILSKCLQKLSQRRDKRTRPALDDKIILGWNALMLKAFAKAATVLGDEEYRRAAELNFQFLKKHFPEVDGSSGLLHTYKNGVAKYPAFLDDYAYIIDALIQLYRATLNENYLHSANEYCSYVIENFSDEEATFFYFTSVKQKDVIVRKKEIYDGATPSGNAIMAENLWQLSIIFDQADWGKRAEKMLRILLPVVIKYPGSFGIWASLLLRHLRGINEIAVVGADYINISQKILLNYVPNMILMSAANGNEKFALLADKPNQTPALIYLCKNYTCIAPFTDVDTLLEKIENTNKIAS